MFLLNSKRLLIILPLHTGACLFVNANMAVKELFVILFGLCTNVCVCIESYFIFFSFNLDRYWKIFRTLSHSFPFGIARSFWYYRRDVYSIFFFCFLFHPKAWKIQHPHACRLRNKYLMMRSPHRGSSATIMATTRWKNLAIHGTSLYLEHGPGLDPSFSPLRRQICFTTSGDSVGSYAISSSYEGK